MKALAALGIVVAGVVTAFAVYTFGWRESESDRRTHTALTATGRHVYTLRMGDVVRVPAAATRCEASAEAGIPNLFCTRTARGRYQVIFYKDGVYVWRLALGPDGPPVVYPWGPKRVVK